MGNEVEHLKNSSSQSFQGRFAAYDLFGEMRNSTPEERELYRQMLEAKGESIGINIFAQELSSSDDTKL